MNVLYDGYIYQLQKAGGVNRYFSEIISRLPAPLRPTLFGSVRPSLHAPSHPSLRHVSPPPGSSLFRAPLRWWASSFEIVHPTYYHLTPPLEWSRITAPIALTVYDFVFSKFADHYERSAKLLRAQEEAITRADLILCISHSTRKDLLERFPACEEKSIVTHLAANVPPVGECARLHPRRYLLFVGARVFYKNFDLAVRTMKILQGEGEEVDLVVAGPAWTREEREFLAREKVENSVCLWEFPTDEQLAALYQHAEALIYPSQYEGFGLPPLEAMTLGTPVLALKSSSLPEVVGEGGILIDPEEGTAEAFASAAGRLLQDLHFRKRLAESAMAHAKTFHWDRTAQETWEAYRRLSSQRR